MPRSIFILIIFACAAISTSIAFAEENAPGGGTVRGAVFDTTAERNPIEGVTVNIVGTDDKVFTVKTDAKGEYKCDNLPAGRYLINISKRGYVDRVGRAVTIVDGGDHFVQIRMQKKGTVDKRFTEMLLKQATEGIGERYKLEKSSVDALYQSLFEALHTGAVLEQGNLVAITQEGSIGVIALLLSRPDSKAAFAKHLTETQLHDYRDFIEARRQQARRTTARFLTAFLDQVLSLNLKQREDVVKLLLDTIADRPELSLPAMDISSQHEVVDLLHNELKISLQTVLTPTQAKIWQGLIHLKNAERDLVGAEVFHPQGEKVLSNDKKDSDDESQLSQLIEAVLTAHTEQQLGTLSEKENQRLRIAIKGVIQEAIEVQEPADIAGKIDYDALDELLVGVMMQDLPREQAIEQLEAIKKTMVDKTGIGKRWERLELHNLPNHPLYQRTIKDVLSEEAYRQYSARQTERNIFQTRASQELFVTFMDMILLLKETHRKQLETTAAQVTLLSLGPEGLSLMVAEIFIRMDPEILSLLKRYEIP